MYAWSFTFFNLNINLFVYIILINIYTFVKRKKNRQQCWLYQILFYISYFKSFCFLYWILRHCYWIYKINFLLVGKNWNVNNEKTINVIIFIEQVNVKNRKVVVTCKDMFGVTIYKIYFLPFMGLMYSLVDMTTPTHTKYFFHSYL